MANSKTPILINVAGTSYLGTPIEKDGVLTSIKDAIVAPNGVNKEALKDYHRAATTGTLETVEMGGPAVYTKKPLTTKQNLLFDSYKKVMELAIAEAPGRMANEHFDELVSALR